MTEHEHAVREIGRRMVKEETRSAGFDTVFPVGTILSCSDCGEGLYRVTIRATTADIVLDDGTMLKLLTMTIPPPRVFRLCLPESRQSGSLCQQSGSGKRRA